MLIGEVAQATGVSTKTLRYYEDEGLPHEPDRTSGGYRDDRPDVVDRVTFIRQAQAAGLTLRQIAEILQIRDGGRAPAGTSRIWSMTGSPTSKNASQNCGKTVRSSANCAPA